MFLISKSPNSPGKPSFPVLTLANNGIFHISERQISRILEDTGYQIDDLMSAWTHHAQISFSSDEDGFTDNDRAYANKWLEQVYACPGVKIAHLGAALDAIVSHCVEIDADLIAEREIAEREEA